MNISEDPNASPALNRALKYIRTNLEAGLWRSGERIPTIAKLAAQTGVGERTMIRAVALLKSKGLIISMKGGGLRVSGPIPPAPTTKKSARKIWQIKRAELENDILKGMYSSTDTLPGFKQLETRYGLCFRTMQKILRSMVTDRALEMRGKAYALPGRKTHPALNRVLFITHAFPTPSRSALNPAEPRVIAAFELESLKRDIAFEIMEIDFGNPNASARAAASIAARKDLQGCVLDIWWLPALRAGYADFINNLVGLKRPIAILDEYANFELELRHTVNPLVQVFRIEGFGAGAKVARNLLNLGHRTVAFFSADPTAPWSRFRSDGIADQFTKAGFDNSIHLFASNEGEGALAILYAFSGFKDSLLKKAISIGRTPDQASALFNDVKKVQAGRRQGRFAPDDLKRLRVFLAPLGAALLSGNTDSKSLVFINAGLISWALRMIGEMLAAPVFDKALSQRNITAWVCASEITALMALHHLKARRVGVPADLSVVGFDNLPGETLEWRLTSFDFNVQGFACRLLDFIARPPKPRGAYRHVPIEIEGGLVVRGTTGRAKINE